MRRAARRLAGASSVAVFEDLGVQMSLHSTLSSYLEKLLWLLTGNFAKPGAQYVPTSLVNIAGGGLRGGGSIAHQPGRRRAHHLRPRARQRHRRGDPHRPPRPLPGHARRERQPGPLARRQPADARGPVVARAPRGDRRRHDRDGPPGALRAARAVAVREVGGHVLQLRLPPQRVPPAAPAARAAARHARRARDPRPAVRGAGRVRRGRRRAAAGRGGGEPGRVRRRLLRGAGRQARARPLRADLLYRTLGPTLPDGAAAAAALWGAAHRCAQENPASVAAAGFTGEGLEAGEQLFDAILASPSGVVFSVDEPEIGLARLRTDDGRVHLAIPELLDELDALATEPAPGGSRRLPVRAVGRRAPVVHRQHDLPRSRRGGSATRPGRCGSAPSTPRGSAWSTAPSSGSPPSGGA